jgi:hypothetical protein
MVRDAGRLVGLVTTISKFATDPLEDTGVYPRCLAIETADDLLTAESKNISLTTIFAK